MSRDRFEIKKTCRTCGADITDHAQYNRWWNQCSVCYWKDCLDRQKNQLEDFMRQRSEIRGQIESVTAQVQRLETDIEHHIANLPVIKSSWWRGLLGPPRDEVLVGKYLHRLELQEDLKHLQGKQLQIESRLWTAKRAKKKFIEAVATRNATEEKRRLKAQEHERFCSETFHNLDRQFERTQFFIQPQDYRRGNAIDNYFRDKISDLVIAAFGNRCIFCGDHDDLTFDHYGLTKNEGGNFVLILADKSSIRINVAVLCRGCNAMKGQIAHSFHFSDDQQEQVKAGQRVLLEALLRDKKFLSLLKKWCS
jgi:hypothetical protein